MPSVTVELVEGIPVSWYGNRSATHGEQTARILELEACIREMQRSVPGGAIANPQEIADDLREIAARYGVMMGDETI